MEWLVAGANATPHRAYAAMLESGFRAQLFGIAMHRNDDPGYKRDDALVIDDRR